MIDKSTKILPFAPTYHFDGIIFNNWSYYAKDFLATEYQKTRVNHNNSKLIYDNAPHPVDIIINANNTEHYKGQAKITLLVVATTIDLSYFSGDYSQDGSYAINGTSQAQLITAINSDTKMNPVIKTAVNTKGIIVATTTKILPNNQPTIAQITIDGTNTKTYFGKAIIKLTVKNNANDPFTIKIGIIKSDSFNGTSSSWYYSQSENFVDYLDYADSMDSFAKKISDNNN